MNDAALASQAKGGSSSGTTSQLVNRGPCAYPESMHRTLIPAALATLAACAGPSIPNQVDRSWPAVAEWTTLDLAHPDNYARPELPAPYHDPAVVAIDNSHDHPITDEGATLGRVLFFDTHLSVDDRIACASCHLPEAGFTDTAALSIGHNGTRLTLRTMRLANARWYAGPGFFWDRRAPTLEAQSTQPVVHSDEMGWDAAHGGLDALIDKLRTLPYYAELFEYAWGDREITTDRLQRSVAMYVRSIIAVRSRWDIGYAKVYDANLPDKGLGRDLPGLGTEENLGRSLFMRSRDDGGFGCASCHVPPTFSLSADSKSNGITQHETVIFKAPSLKNVALAGPYMHNGRFPKLELAVAFYGGFFNDGPALDDRLRGPDGGQLRQPMSGEQRKALTAFLRTLTDTISLQDRRYSDPFRH